jgi:putative salt-induced outer membrane protein YdiY
MNRILRSSLMGLTVFAVSFAATARAADDKAAKKDTEGWVTGLALGLNLTRGNSKTMLGNASLKSENRKGQNEWTLGAEGNYGETEVTVDGEKKDETNIQNAKGNVEYRRLFTERTYGYLRAELAYDEIANLKYRLTVGPGAGHYLIKSDRQLLGVEGGVAYIWDKLGDEKDNRAAFRAAQNYNWKVSETARIWETVEYLPTADDWGNYLLNAEVGAEAAMTTKVNLRVVLQDKFNSRPAPDKKENDLTLIAGIKINI